MEELWSRLQRGVIYREREERGGCLVVDVFGWGYGLHGLDYIP